jgi:hypothetical protein
VPKKKPPDPNEKPQRERFIELARAAETDESPEAFERLFKRAVVDTKKKTPKRKKPSG